MSRPVLAQGHDPGPASSQEQAAGRPGGAVLSHPVPVTRAYEQLAEAIRRRILAGQLQVGQGMPSELALAREAHVSRSTVREALRMLQEAGFLQRVSPKVLLVSNSGGDPAAQTMENVLRRENVSFADLVIALLAIEPGIQ